MNRLILVLVVPALFWFSPRIADAAFHKRIAPSRGGTLSIRTDRAHGKTLELRPRWRKATLAAVVGAALLAPLSACTTIHFDGYAPQHTPPDAQGLAHPKNSAPAQVQKNVILGNRQWWDTDVAGDKTQ